jgi:hypothetical protein
MPKISICAGTRGETVGKKEDKVFSLEAHADKLPSSRPHALLPKNLTNFWIDGILDAANSNDDVLHDTALIMAIRSCRVIKREGEIAEKEMHDHADFYLYEILKEKFSRAGAISYQPAKLEGFFAGLTNSGETTSDQLKIIDKAKFARLNAGLSGLFFEMIAGSGNCSEGGAACAAVPIANLGEQVADSERVFSFPAFTQEFTALKPVRYLPRNLPDYWLNQMLDVCYSGDDATFDEFQRTIAFICVVLGGCGDILKNPLEIKKLDKCVVRYMLELKFEQLARIGAIKYQAAKITNIFKPSRNSESVIGVKILNRELFRAVKARYDKMVENRGDDYDEKPVLPADAHGQEIVESTFETV